MEIGDLDHPDDVFFLTADEVQNMIHRSPAPGVRERVAARKADIEQSRTLDPPPFLGTISLMAPPPEDPFVRAMSRVVGADALEPAERPAPPAPRRLQGQAASAGVARGPVRVLRVLSESDRVRPGDIVVAEATMPTWTPLFAIAAGVITDVGGILSHAAITAREYGIPAIVGARDASVILRDDQLVEVDGNTGVVRLIDA